MQSQNYIKALRIGSALLGAFSVSVCWMGQTSSAETGSNLARDNLVA
jgi:hypothetical protein